MQLQGDLRRTYNPARIYDAAVPNSGHVQQPIFNDEQLGKPNSPIQPTRLQTKHGFWVLLAGSALLFLFFLAAPLVPLACVGLIALWAWAIAIYLPRYRVAKRKAEAEYRQQQIAYETDKAYFDRIVLPDWRRKQRPLALKQKLYDWRQTAIDEACQRKSWCVHSPAEIAAVREQGFVGIGEDELVRSLQDAGVFVRHQVAIDSTYTADLVCFNPDSGKLCIVEVDGRQHWCDSNQVDRDNQRMARLAAQGVPTIRFINAFAQANPRRCVVQIRQFLD